MRTDIQSSNSTCRYASFDTNERFTLALYEQTQGESVRTKEAVAIVMANKLRTHGATGPWCDKRTGSFRCACRLTPAESANSRKSTTVKAIEGNVDHNEIVICKRIARRVISGAVSDPTQGANAYHTFLENPDWARSVSPIASVGSFLFYRISETPEV